MTTSTLGEWVWLIPVLPVLGFVLNGVFGGRWSAPVVAAVGLAGPLAALGLSVALFAEVAAGQVVQHTVATWFETGGVSVSLGFTVDALSGVMLLVVTGIGSLIHLYSYGYMKDDPSVARFFAYLNLFMGSMLTLVLGDNLLVLFVGWEGVGLCSYLLIGFWYADFANVDAGRKAFIVNRIGDLAFLLGVFLLFMLAGTFSFEGLHEALDHVEAGAVVPSGPLAGVSVFAVLTLAAGCLFVGATGKSAQIPLYVWLPDAMAGPTPVSALIHAATMVTAGIYLLCRMSFVYGQTPEVLAVVGVVAACTALLSGLIAVAQDDIKKVLAYSTVSQLGFMFAGVAASAFSAGLFHVVTHAFFKALLFLGAGAVIHALHGEQDIRKMGGLWRDLRVVAVLFLIGSAALAGLPPFAGFFSKDAILAAVLAMAMVDGGVWWAVFGMLLGTAGLTAFYTARLCWYVFFAPEVAAERGAHGHAATAHGSHGAADHGAGHADGDRGLHMPDWTMLLPLVVLAVLSAVGGIALSGRLDAFLEPVLGGGHDGPISEDVHHTAHNIAMGLSIAVASLGVLLGVFVYRGAHGEPLERGVVGLVYRWARGKFYVDELYEALVVSPVMTLSRTLFAIVDRALVDGLAVEGSGRLTLAVGAWVRKSQMGIVNAAAAAMMAGAVILLVLAGVR